MLSLILDFILSILKLFTKCYESHRKDPERPRDSGGTGDSVLRESGRAQEAQGRVLQAQTAQEKKAKNSPSQVEKPNSYEKAGDPPALCKKSRKRRKSITETVTRTIVIESSGSPSSNTNSY